MYLFADYVIWNGIDFITGVITKTAPFLNGGVIVDTGSTDGTLEVCTDLIKYYPHITLINFGSLAPDYNICNARNAGWLAAPPQTTWHWNIADDEIYNTKELPRLIKFLEEHEHAPQRFVRLKFWEYGFSGRESIKHSGPYSRAMIHRWDPNARWIGKWGREGLRYTDGKHHVNADPSDYLDPDFYYHHFSWLREKQGTVTEKYKQLWGE